MKHYITLTDSDILTMDDASGDIVINIAKLPPRIEIGELVQVSYKEDPDNIFHEYSIKSIDGDEVALSWVKQLGESLLTEAPLASRLRKAANKTDRYVAKEEKKADKQREKLLKQLVKLLKRELSPEAQNWKFYFPDAKGKYGQPVDQATAKQKYLALEGDEITPEVANAIVTTDSGYLNRRGLEDLYRQGVGFTPETAKLKPEYSIPVDIVDSPEEEQETPPTAAQQTDMNNADDNTDKKDNVEETPVDAKKSSYISRKTIDEFKKLAKMTGVDIVDAEGKRIDSNVLTTKNLTSYGVKIKNKTYKLAPWIRLAVKDGVLNEAALLEAEVKLAPEDLFNPDKVDLKQNVSKALEKERVAAENQLKLKREQQLKDKYAGVTDKLAYALKNHKSVQETINILFDALVPASGAADSAAGELVRAIMRILYRWYNDGDKFFEGYGLEVAGGSAEFLFDNGFEVSIQKILDDNYRLADDDDLYEDAILTLTEHVINAIHDDSSLLWTVNDKDSRDYSNEYIVENQPMYEFEIPCSDDVGALVDKGVLTSWDLNRYVEEMLSYESVFNGAEVARPWSYNDTSVTVENLTRDGYERLQDSVTRNLDGWWEELASNYTDELSDNELDDDDID